MPYSGDFRRVAAGRGTAAWAGAPGEAWIGVQAARNSASQRRMNLNLMRLKRRSASQILRPARLSGLFVGVQLLHMQPQLLKGRARRAILIEYAPRRSAVLYAVGRF